MSHGSDAELLQQQNLQIELIDATVAAELAKREMPKPKTLVQKLADIVREIDHVEKSGRNTFQNYNYVKAADVAWAVRKHLSDRNIYLVADVVEIRNYEIPAREGVMQAVDIKMQFSFFDGDAPDTLPIVLHSYGTGTDKGDKAVYKAMTGALKYGLRHAFLIPDESDPEADEKVDKATASANAKAVGEQKVNELSQKAKKADKTVPALFYLWRDDSQTAEITGSEELLKEHRLALKPFWNGAVRAIMVNAEQLENLKYFFEQKGVEFRKAPSA